MKDMALQNTATVRTETATVGSLEDFPVDSMKMAKVGDSAVAVIRTSKGVFALDNACPHQGYGLTTGALTVDDQGDAQITCQWHNWKFSQDGTCTIGEEDVASHAVCVTKGEVQVTVTTPSDDDLLDKLWPSFRRGLENDYIGQVSRDTIRLLDAGATPTEILWEGLRIGAPKHEWGPGHDMAFAADCLQMTQRWTGDDRILPLVQGLSGIAEDTRDRPAQPLPTMRSDAEPDADPGRSMVEAIEREDVDGAILALLAAIEAGASVETIRHHFIDATSRHHLDYGHGGIYVQKAFELIDRAGSDQADRKQAMVDLLPSLVRTIGFGTREETLPYMRKFMNELADINLDELAVAGAQRHQDWDAHGFANRLLDSMQQPLGLAVAAVHAGAGIEGLLDAVSLCASKRLLRYDLRTESEHDNFGWLDISHGLTYARAARWAWQLDPGPHTARLALFTVWLAFDTGRLERRTHAEATKSGAAEQGFSIDPPEVSAAASGVTNDQFEATFERLARAALDGRAGSFIVLAHLLKTSLAAYEESVTIGSSAPLAAAARLVYSPRRERFVARNVAESLEFIRSGRPPRR